MNEMRTMTITEAGSPEVLQLRHRPIPVPKANEVLVKIVAAGVNRPDVLQRKGQYPAPKGAPQDIPGLEVAGTIIECGVDVQNLDIGASVCALVAGGGYAEYIAVPEGQCIAMPSNLTFTEAAGIPETTFTVWHNVFQLGALKEGEGLLVHGGSSGIGTTAIQLAKALGASVFTTVGNTEKQQYCVDLGANLAINYNEDDFEEVLSAQGVDVILDMIGGSYFQKNMNILNPDGRLIHINAMLGRSVSLDILQMMVKRIKISGSTLRARSIQFKSLLAVEIKKNVWPIIEENKYRPIVYEVLPLEEAAKAHEIMESSQHIGKIILAIE